MRFSPMQCSVYYSNIVRVDFSRSHVAGLDDDDDEVLSEVSIFAQILPNGVCSACRAVR